MLLLETKGDYKVRYDTLLGSFYSNFDEGFLFLVYSQVSLIFL